MTASPADHEGHLRHAISLAQENLSRGGRPFGAVLVLNGTVVATGVNEVLERHDISAHAELLAVRAACQKLSRTSLAGAVVYASGHPCPMCLAALITAGVEAVYYAFDNADAEPYGLSSARTYEALGVTPEEVRLPLTRLDVGVRPDELYGPWRARTEQ